MPSGNYLEGVFQLNFELNNQVFSTGATDVLAGSFTFPLNVPLTPKNQIELSFPHLINRATDQTTMRNSATKWIPGTGSAELREIDGVWIEVYNVPMFLGSMRILSATPDAAKVTIVANPMLKLKQRTLPELDLGGDRTFGADDTARRATMKNTALTPEDYDFVFFPMVGTLDNINEFVVVDDETKFHNFYNRSTQEFDLASLAITPFVKLEYLIERIFASEDTGYSFQNVWQGSTETKRYYIYNNRDMRESVDNAAPALPEEFDLVKFVPAVQCTDLLKAVCAQFNLGIFTNIFSGKIRLVPIDELIAKPPARDWTEHAIGQQKIEPAQTAPGIFNYQQPMTPPADWPSPQQAIQFLTGAQYYANTDDFDDLGKYFFVEDIGRLFRYVAYIAGPNIRKHDGYIQHQGVYLDTQEVYEIAMQSVGSYSVYYYCADEQSKYVEEDDGGTNVWKFRPVLYPMALMAYRGIQEVFAGLGAEPFAANYVWLPGTNPPELSEIITDGVSEGDSDHSLNWYGNYGLYQRRHVLWNTMLREGRNVTQQFALPIGELIAFSFEDKIRVGNMDYFVKKLRVGKPLGQSRLLVEASMVSVI